MAPFPRSSCPGSAIVARTESATVPSPETLTLETLPISNSYTYIAEYSLRLDHGTFRGLGVASTGKGYMTLSQEMGEFFR
jgi:hypothetical protein